MQINEGRKLLRTKADEEQIEWRRTSKRHMARENMKERRNQLSLDHEQIRQLTFSIGHWLLSEPTAPQPIRERFAAAAVHMQLRDS